MAIVGRHHISATCIALAVMAGTSWVQAHATLAALHDDGAIVHAVASTIDEPAVRSGLKAVLDQAVVRTAAAHGTDVSGNPAVSVLTTALTSDAAITGTVDTWTGVLLTVRDQVVTQVSASTAATPLVVDIAPALAQAGVTLPPDLAPVFGATGASLEIQLADSRTLAQMQQRYRLEQLTDRWAWLVAVVLLVVGVLASRNRVRTVTIAAGATVALSLLAKPLLGWLVSWSTGSAWGAVLQPVLNSGTGYVVPLARTVGIVSAVVAAAGIAWEVWRHLARRRPDKPAAASLGT